MPQMPPRKLPSAPNTGQRIAPAYMRLDACGADLRAGRRRDLGLRPPDHAPAWYEWLVIPVGFLHFQCL